MIKTRIGELFIEQKIHSRYSLAQELGIHRTTVSNLIDNEELKRIELGTIEKLCRVFNVTPNDIFHITNDDGTAWSPIGSQRGIQDDHN